jgi:uncharacterized YigZ family protein
MARNILKSEEPRYKSITSDATAELTIKRSKFIANLRRTNERSHFDSFLQEISGLHPKANHNCWAYIIRYPSRAEHSSDAGEPSGTAGRPILGALRQNSLENITAIITRYYGGIKLGVKGLIDAYGVCTKLAIEAAEIKYFEPHSLMSFSISYNLYNTLLSIMARYPISLTPLNRNFSTTITGEIKIPNSIHDSFLNDIKILSHDSDAFSFLIKKSDDMTTS